MRKFLTLAAIVVALGLAAFLVMNFAGVNTTVLVVRGNTDKQPLPIEMGNTQDAQCGMIIDSLEYAAQAIAPDGRTWFFHDLGGVALFLAGKPFEHEAVIWVHTLDTQSWIDGRGAFYSRAEKTPMFYGFGAYEKPQEGFVDYNEMRAMMLRGENLTNPAVRRRLLGAS